MSDLSLFPKVDLTRGIIFEDDPTVVEDNNKVMQKKGLTASYLAPRQILSPEGTINIAYLKEGTLEKVFFPDGSSVEYSPRGGVRAFDGQNREVEYGGKLNPQGIPPELTFFQEGDLGIFDIEVAGRAIGVQVVQNFDKYANACPHTLGVLEDALLHSSRPDEVFVQMPGPTRPNPGLQRMTNFNGYFREKGKGPKGELVTPEESLESAVDDIRAGKVVIPADYAPGKTVFLNYACRDILPGVELVG